MALVFTSLLSALFGDSSASFVCVSFPVFNQTPNKGQERQSMDKGQTFGITKDTRHAITSLLFAVRFGYLS